MTRRNARKQGWVFPLFSPDSDDRLSLNFHRFVIWYRSCGTQSVGLGQHCLPKGSNGFKDTGHCYIGNCQRPVFSHAVSQHMHKITNLWKFELDWSSELQDNYERKKHPWHTKLCAFRCLISRPQVLNLRSRNQIRGKLLLSRKLCHFRGSRFSQCFKLSTSPHYSLPSEVLCW